MAFFTQQSEFLMSFFENNNCIDRENLTEKTQKIMSKIYYQMCNASVALNNAKRAATKRDQSHFYKLVVTKITDPSQIAKPASYDNYFFPNEMRTYIDTHTLYTLTYTFPIKYDNDFERKITVIITIENNPSEDRLRKYDKYIEYIYRWLHMINNYASTMCSKELTIYLYLTNAEKTLPKHDHHTIDVTNVNTAYTTTCEVKSAIVIYRKEEWLKVLFHESVHNFALDFSNMDNKDCTERMLRLFPIKSKVNLFEAYAEFWAELMNAAFASFEMIHGNNRSSHLNNCRDTHLRNLNTFLFHFNDLIHYELNYSLFQMTKALRFMGLTYHMLYSTKADDAITRSELYKENTNVFSYYVVKTILLINYQPFLDWCDTHKDALLQFKQTSQNQSDFCDFIEKHYLDDSILTGTMCAEYILDNLDKATPSSRSKNKTRSNKQSSLIFLKRNLRMSICELK